jgi:hypothetical protein
LSISLRFFTTPSTYYIVVALHSPLKMACTHHLETISSANDVLSRVFNNIGADEPDVHIQHWHAARGLGNKIIGGEDNFVLYFLHSCSTPAVWMRLIS